MAVLFTRRGFAAIVLLPASSQSSCVLSICCFNDRTPYNQLYSTAVPLFSLVNTDIHQYPISFSWSQTLYPALEKSAVVVIQKYNFHCNKTRFVLGSDTSEKS